MTRSGGGARTPLEDRVRDAIRAKAAEVPPDAVPPLRLPGRRRSSFLSLTAAGREKEDRRGGRGPGAPGPGGPGPRPSPPQPGWRPHWPWFSRWPP